MANINSFLYDYGLDDKSKTDSEVVLLSDID